MRCTYKYLIAIAPVALSCGVVGGQEGVIDAPSAAMSQTELKTGDIRASNLLGAMVKRLTGESIGEVEDLVVSADAEVRLAVISVGGVLGLGGKTVAIPFDQFTVAPDGSTLFLAISEEDLRARPAFDLEGDINGLHSGAAQPAVPEEQTNSQAHDRAAGSAHTFERREVSQGVPQQAALELDRDVGSVATKAKASKQPASTLIGARVIDSQSLPIGKINDLIVTAEPLEVQVILELSGASESISRLVAVPLPEFMVSRDDAADSDGRIESVETSLTVSQLEVLPQFQY